MFVVIRNNNVTGLTKAPINNAEEIDNAIDCVRKLCTIHEAMYYVRDSLNELEDICIKTNNKLDTHSENIRITERKIRAFLFEYRAYFDHVCNQLSGDLRKTFKKEMNRLFKDGLFCFVWELRNYGTHQGSIVYHLAYNEDGSRSKVFGRWQALKQYILTGKRKRRSTSLRNYVNTIDASVDLLELFIDATEKIKTVHRWIIQEMIKQGDNRKFIDILSTEIDKLQSVYNYPDRELCRIHFAKAIFLDRQGFTNEEDVQKHIDGNNDHEIGIVIDGINLQTIKEIKKLTEEMQDDVVSQNV